MLGLGAINKTKSLPSELNSDVAPAHEGCAAHRTAGMTDIQRREGHRVLGWVQGSMKTPAGLGRKGGVWKTRIEG